MAEAQDVRAASNVKSKASCRSDLSLSAAELIDREIVLVRREQELLRTRRAQRRSRTSASDGQPATSGRLRRHASRRLTSPESVGVPLGD